MLLFLSELLLWCYSTLPMGLGNQTNHTALWKLCRCTLSSKSGENKNQPKKNDKTRGFIVVIHKPLSGWHHSGHLPFMYSLWDAQKQRIQAWLAHDYKKYSILKNERKKEKVLCRCTLTWRSWSGVMIMDYQVMFVLSPMFEWTKLSIDFPGAWSPTNVHVWTRRSW